ncbi:MAG TPA: hypothetical protein VJN18_20745 [Polyangiaceae bacterium]|nr:hypothetical protein [Polyangiaceae bacterium]
MPSEFILYPNPREITSLPAHEIQPFIFERLTAEADRTPDLEYTMGLGQMARMLNVLDVEPPLLRWLDDEPTSGRYDAAGLFLFGYWPGREPSASLVGKLLVALEAFAHVLSARDSIIIAITVAFVNSTSDGLKLRIREKFAPLRARREEFQPSVQEDIDTVLAEDLKHIQKKPLP